MRHVLQEGPPTQTPNLQPLQQHDPFNHHQDSGHRTRNHQHLRTISHGSQQLPPDTQTLAKLPHDGRLQLPPQPLVRSTHHNHTHIQQHQKQEMTIRSPSSLCQTPWLHPTKHPRSVHPLPPKHQWVLRHRPHLHLRSRNNHSHHMVLRPRLRWKLRSSQDHPSTQCRNTDMLPPQTPQTHELENIRVQDQRTGNAGDMVGKH